jgi:hypothetical protein
VADNVGYTPGSGATIAADDIGGVLHQRIKLGIGADGTAVDVSSANPMPVNASNGELVEALEALRMATNTLTKTMGFALPNALGQPIMEARQATAGNLNATITGNIGTVTTVSTLTNQSQMGGFASNDQIPAFMHLQADNLRRNISVT